MDGQGSGLGGLGPGASSQSRGGSPPRQATALVESGPSQPIAVALCQFHAPGRHSPPRMAVSWRDGRPSRRAPAGQQPEIPGSPFVYGPQKGSQPVRLPRPSPVDHLHPAEPLALVRPLASLSQPASQLSAQDAHVPPPCALLATSITTHSLPPATPSPDTLHPDPANVASDPSSLGLPAVSPPPPPL